MKVGMIKPRGELPSCAPEHLPVGFGTTVINAKLTSGNLEGFFDFGNPYTLAKTPAPFNTIWLMRDPNTGNTFWLQWKQTEVSYGPNIDVSLGTIPGDTTVRIMITGLAGGPQQTNLFYATDPSQQGSSILHAYPYKTFPLGVANPTTAPTVSAPSAPPGPTTNFEYAQPIYVNSLTVSGGTGYKQFDILNVPGGTIPTGLTGARVQVTDIDPSTGAVTGSALLEPGFYTVAPPASGSLTGGSGTGAGYTSLLTVPLTTFQTWQTTQYDNGAGSHGWFSVGSGVWHIDSAQGDTYVFYSTDSYNLKTNATTVYQIDMVCNNEGGNICDGLVQFSGSTVQGPPFARLHKTPGVAYSVTDQTFTLYSDLEGSNGGALAGTVVNSTSTVGLAAGTWYRITVTLNANTTGTAPGFDVTATIATQAAPTSILYTVKGFVPYGGEVLAGGLNHRGDHSPGSGNNASFNNILVACTATAQTVASEATNYVQVYRNLFSQESGPGTPSNTITVYLNTATVPNTFGPVTVVSPVTPGGQDVDLIDNYRLVNAGGASEVYEFVTSITAVTLGSVVGGAGAFVAGQDVTTTSGITAVVIAWNSGSGVLQLRDVSAVIPVGDVITGPTGHGTYTASANSTTSITFTDSALDSDLSGELESTIWIPPPSNLQNIVSTANGVMAGFFANTLCLSVPYEPQAWPTAYQYTVSNQIVALQTFGNQVIILTQGKPGVAYGNDPSNYYVNDQKSPQGFGCVSKLSAATHSTFGTIYATGTGLACIRGEGDMDLLRRENAIGEMVPLFSFEAWQLLNPSSIIGCVHQNWYFFWYTTLAGVKGGYALDLRPDGFGLIELDFHPSCVYNDPLPDYLYVVPDNSVYPINGSVISAASNVVSQWDYTGSSSQRPKSWKRDFFLGPYPWYPTCVRVRASGYTGLTLTLSNENGTLFNGAVADANSFNTDGTSGIEPGQQYAITIVDTGSNTVYDIVATDEVLEMS